MADPNLEDLAELTGDNPYVELLAAGAPSFLAKVSDSMRDVVGSLGQAKRRILRLEQDYSKLEQIRQRDVEILDALAELHRLPEWGTEGRCAGCRRKWPCKTARILGVD